MIAIIVAMEKELKLLLSLVEDRSSTTLNGYAMHTGKISGRDVAVMKCGIGKVNAAIATLSLIDAMHPDIVVNTGVAGGTGQGAGILDLVLADGIAYHDVWCGPGTEWGEAAGCPRIFATAGDAADLATKIGAKTGLIASGDIFVSRKQEVDHILSLYPRAIAVDMESGAIAQTCYLKGVPMLCMRVVSDTPGAADNISQYQNFWEDAPQHTFQALKALLSEL